MATATPAATAAPTPSPDLLAALPAFVDELGDALRRGRDAFLFEHLHPAVFERYGAAACQAFTASARIAGLSLEYVAANGPAPYEWQLDGVSTTVDDGWLVSVHWQQPGTDEQRDIHLAPHDGEWRWFTDCGDPLST